MTHRASLPIMSRVSFPDSEELRMLRAIVLIATEEAACIGDYRATFRGFHIHARRMIRTTRGLLVRVELRCGTAVLDRSNLDVIAPRISGRSALSFRSCGSVALYMPGSCDGATCLLAEIVSAAVFSR